ncbi:hypothetical protein RIF29_30875 [Crotalaria pallida]|uniref:Uncharacterized protein n=1 Tax=Crotalaria pallida TaxID=3830 RepID=A0AAN9EGM5_CROPI
MGAKGKKRREKNYRAAHGGYTALPPPPDPSKLDALPSKLRQIISFTHSQHHHNNNNNSNGAAADGGLSKDLNKKKERDDAQIDKGEVRTADVKQGGELVVPQHNDSANEKKKKKRKRKEVKDLRFAMEVDKTSSQLKRKERKKKYLESKKKKHKKTQDQDEEILDFPGHEKVKFGDVVQAPPKLAVIPKAFKNTQDASQERLRLRAIEEYRSRKGWTSRPGVHLPPPVTSDP